MGKQRLRRIGTLAGVVVAVLLLRTFVFGSFYLPSGGMEGSVLPGERILVSRWSYGLRTPLLSLFPYRRWAEHRVQQHDVVLFNNPAEREVQPIDRREPYIGRCLGTPGDTLWVDATFSAVSPHLYHLLRSTPQGGGRHPLVVPAKGKYVRVYPWNAVLLCNTLLMHEGRQAAVHQDTLYIDGVSVQHCYFTKDYYWMTTDRGADSRLFGFVPQDHLIGKAALVWFSKEQGTGLFAGYRFRRFFHIIQ